MTFQDEIKSLAKLLPSPYPFYSLYLNVRWDSEKQRERVRIFVKSALRESVAGREGATAEARNSLANDTEGIEQYVKGLVNREWDDGYRGIALFSCAGLGVHTVLRSHIPFEEALHCSDRPILRPAVEQLPAALPAILCLIAGSSGRLLEFALGALLREFRFRDEAFPGRHEQGGWNQGRYQRHVDEHLARNFKTISEQLVRWVEEKDVKTVLLSGTEADLSVFERHLPKRVAGLIAGRLKIDPNARMDSVLDDVDAALSRVRREEETEMLDKLFEMGLGLGRAVHGLEPVAQAVAVGRVHSLYVDKNFRESGWACRPCRLFSVKIPIVCPSCGKQGETVELGEELVCRALAADAAVTIVQDQPLLSAGGGVAAVLRHG